MSRNCERRYTNAASRSILLACDGGRVCRPYIIVKNCVSMFTDEHTQQLKEKVRTFADCLREGLVEYLDVNEQNDCLIALDEM
jgi:DNA-directed RNA polymerase III subunit RPC2